MSDTEEIRLTLTQESNYRFRIVFDEAGQIQASSLSEFSTLVLARAHHNQRADST